MTQEKEKISELAEILTLYAGVEYLAKQVGSWSTQVPPEQRYYHSEGRHRGPRGGRFSVIGTEVDQDGESLAQEGQSKSNQAEKVRDWVESNTEAQHVLDTLSQYGTPYVVGGGVRDALLGTPSKDVDIEVYGVSIDELSDIVKKDLGGKQDQVGKIFGVFKVGDFDISLPRTETKTGEKHTDFDVEPNPNLSPELAAKRRDFTINALMYDHKNNEILDFFGGVQDLESKRIKHVSQETFVEDPLRVYRAAQFASRFDFSIDPSTQELARSMDLSEISNERVFGEFEKLLLKSSTPSTGIQALDDMGVLDTQFPEVATLKDTHQRSDHHAEGDVFTHTKMTLDKAAEIIQRFPDQKDKTIIMLAALCHDLGKPETTTSDGRAIGHEEAGVSITKEFLGKLTNDREILETVPSLVKDHLKPLQYYRDGASDAAFRRLINKHGTEYLNLLSAVSEADASGRLVKQSDGSVTGHGNEENVWFRDRIKQVSEAGGLKEGKIAPLITGDDLKSLGFKEGRELGDILRDVQGQQEEGEIASADEALEYVRDKYQSQQAEEETAPAVSFGSHNIDPPFFRDPYVEDDDNRIGGKELIDVLRKEGLKVGGARDTKLWKLQRPTGIWTTPLNATRLAETPSQAIMSELLMDDELDFNLPEGHQFQRKINERVPKGKEDEYVLVDVTQLEPIVFTIYGANAKENTHVYDVKATLDAIDVITNIMDAESDEDEAEVLAEYNRTHRGTLDNPPDTNKSVYNGHEAVTTVDIPSDNLIFGSDLIDELQDAAITGDELHKLGDVVGVDIEDYFLITPGEDRTNFVTLASLKSILTAIAEKRKADGIVFKADDGEKLEFGMYMPNYDSMQESRIQGIRQKSKKEVKKSDDLPELLTLLASVEHLFKQGESEWARFKDWTWDLAENKKHYHSDGRHTGSRGGTYDVIGYEVTAEGKPIGPGRVTGVAPPRGEVGLVGGEPSPSLQAKWENKPVSASQPNSLPQDINDLVTLDEYSKGLTEISKAELQQMVKDAYVQGRGTGALDSTPIQPNIAVFSEDDKGQKSLVGVSTGDGHWVAARLMDPANPLGGGKQDIMINRNVDGKVQATSIDKRGNKEAVYSWAWSANSERENHDKVGRLIESGAAEKIIKRMKSDIKNPKPVQGGPKGVEKTREAAAAAAVISLTGRRPGSPKQASEVSVAEKFRKSKLSNAQAAGAVKDAKGIPQSSKIVIKEDMLKLNKTPEGLVAKIDVRTFGVSTLQGRHVRDNGDGSVTLQFLGKAGKLNEATVTDKEVAADLLSRKKKAGDKGQIFNISAGGVNDYIRSLTVKAAGKGATSKNLRTLNATMTARAIIKSESIPTVASIGDRQVSQVGVAEFEASVEYAEIKQVDKLKNAQRKAGAKEIGFLSSAERENFLRDWVQRQQDKKKLEIVGEPVADEIGNTPAIAIGEYVNPALFSEWDSYFQTEVEKLVSGPTLSPRKETSIRKRIKQIASKKRAKKGKRG